MTFGGPFQNPDDFILGTNNGNGMGNNNGFGNTGNVAGLNNFNGTGNGNNVETIVDPTRTIVNTTTNRRTVRRVHPTHIINVNRNITRVENYYPVTQSVQNQNIVEEYDCGSDLRNPCCRPRRSCC